MMIFYGLGDLIIVMIMIILFLLYFIVYFEVLVFKIMKIYFWDCLCGGWNNGSVLELILFYKYFIW